MSVRIPLVLLLVLACTASAASEIYRCTSRQGGVTYQETPCAGGGESRAMSLSFPEPNVAERERLLRREAALDARLLRRAEIESAERIARDERIARERIAQAELEAARLDAEARPLIVVARPGPYFRRSIGRPHPLYRPWDR